jgi:hypothetical protein
MLIPPRQRRALSSRSNTVSGIQYGAAAFTRNTVRHYLRGKRLPRYERELLPRKVDPYKHYIAKINGRFKSDALDYSERSARAVCTELPGNCADAARSTWQVKQELKE